MKSVLFVCTGNICRSPTADALLREHISQSGTDLRSDSCGTHAYHVGEQPDQRTMDVAMGHGIDMTSLRARKLALPDFDEFDFLIAMDAGHYKQMLSLCPDQYRDKVKLLLDYTSDYKGADVPDPYYGDRQGFEDCFQTIELGVKAFLKQEGFL
ncbi:MAG: low molecular weight protein-tyrosine-phosphatase [Alphaproteobacteria bacterium]